MLAYRFKQNISPKENNLGASNRMISTANLQDQKVNLSAHRTLSLLHRAMAMCAKYDNLV